MPLPALFPPAPPEPLVRVNPPPIPPKDVDPAPAIFDIALERLGMDRKEVVHVGDDPILDVQGAQAAGMRVIQVTSSRTRGTGIAAVRGGMGKGGGN